MLALGFIGLGKMGRPMSHNLLKAGFPLTVHNRSRAAVAELERSGATAAHSPQEVSARSEVVMTCLPNVASVEEVYFGKDGLIEAARPGRLLIDHSTVGPKTSLAIHAAAKKKGVAFLDAPVSGGPLGATNAALTIMVGGEKADFDRAMPVFQAMGKAIRLCGPPSSGAIIKLANQLLVAIHTAAAAEALAFVTKAGGDPKIALEVLGTAFAASAMLNRNGPLTLERKFEPGTPVDLILKDLRLIAEVADESGTRILMGGQARQAFTEASLQGLGLKDMAALVQPLERLAGIEVRAKA